ncbi:hypothetical protein Btru_029015, partial [Bulinus truncatus]
NCSDASDYRTKECAKHNDFHYGHRTYVWEPYINSATPCELTCKSAGHGYYAKFKDVVDDGVICNENNTAVCMNGQCLYRMITAVWLISRVAKGAVTVSSPGYGFQPRLQFPAPTAGCDGVLGSETPVDKCGVCAGDGSTCRFIRGIYTRTHLPSRRYSDVTVIPAGARNIKITEMGPSRNHIALSAPTKGYFLNGEMRLQGEGEVQGAGTTFSYRRRTATGGCNGECLLAPGPLNSSVRVELISFGRNPGITYEYSVDLDSSVLVRGHHRDLSGASQDGHGPLVVPEAGRGDAEQRDEEPNKLRSEIIPRIRHGKTPILAAEYNLKKQTHPLQLHHHHQRQHHHSQKSHSTAPSVRQESVLVNESPKLKGDHSVGTDANHRHGDIQHYAKGGNSSIVYKHYYHTNELDDLGDVPMIDSKQHRSHSAISQAKEPTWLENEDSFDDGRYAEFSATTQYHPPQQLPSSFPAVIAASLVNQKRTSHADNYYSGHDNRLSEKQATQQSYSWRISGLTPCTETCGGGLQEPRVVCVKEGSHIEVIPENCDERKKPATTIISCNTQPCGASWELNEWGPCSVTCGRGLQKRVIECKQRISPTLSISVSSSSCPQPQPPTRQFCQLDPCYMWKVSNWSKCSVECGFGQRKRDVYCTDAKSIPASETLCSYTRPGSEEICNMGSCAQGWFHSKWSTQCSTECGNGHYIREVFCLSPDGSKLDDVKCGRTNKPQELKSCKTSKPCGGQWFTGPWSHCNVTCGTKGFRHRDVFCIKHHGNKVNQIVKEHNCLREEKPVQNEPCGASPDCKHDWYMSTWSECSKTCGTGVRTREIKCLDGNHVQSADCDKALKPSRRQPCSTQPCVSNNVKVSSEDVTTSNDAVQMDWSAPAASAGEAKRIKNNRKKS